MELLSIILSALIGILSPAGFAVDQIAEDAIRSRLADVEQLEVRVDNAPSYQLLQGKVNKIQIAGRGLYPIPEFRIAVLDIETDPVDVNVQKLRRRGKIKLDEPLQAGVRLVLETEDINQLLRSPRITEQIRDFGINFLNTPQAIQALRYDLVNPQVTFLDGNRLRAEVSLQDQDSREQLDLMVESGLQVENGSQLQLIDPMIEVNGKPAPPQLVRALSEGVSRQLNLRSLQDSGITIRLLQLEVDSEALQAAAFIRIEPSVTLSGN